MKTTYIKSLLLIFCVVSLASCMKDLGNYDYTPADELMPIVISGYSDTTVLVGDLLEITPEITMDDENRYVYTWYAYPTAAAGVVAVRDTLSHERNLSKKIVLPANTYNLIYEVKDPQLGVFVSKKTKLTVDASLITNGWYIMKEVGDETDVDYVNNDGELIPNLLDEQFFRQDTVDGPVSAGNMRLKGKPLKMVYQTAYYSHQLINANGTTQSTKTYPAYHIVTDRDLKIFNGSTKYLLKEYEKAFYFAPEIKEIRNFALYGSRELVIVNNAYDVSDTGAPAIHGKAHTITGSAGNVGKFSFPISATIGGHSNYNLHRDGLLLPGYLFTYDMTSRQFVFVQANSATVIPMNNETTGAPDLLTISQLTNYDLVWMIDRNPSTPEKTGYALLRSRLDNTCLLASVFFKDNANTYAFSKFLDVPLNARLLQADVVDSPKSASCIYFAKGNLLSYHLDATDLDISQRERDIYTFPADETVAFISNTVSTHLTVLTNNASGWNLYHIPLVGSTSDIEPGEHKPIKSGTGVGRYVMKR